MNKESLKHRLQEEKKFHEGRIKEIEDELIRLGEYCELCRGTGELPSELCTSGYADCERCRGTGRSLS